MGENAAVQQLSVNLNEPKYRMPDIIAKKRDGGELSTGEIEWFIENMPGQIDVDDSQIGRCDLTVNLAGLLRNVYLLLS